MKGKRPLGKHRHRWENNTRIDLGGIWWEVDSALCSYKLKYSNKKYFKIKEQEMKIQVSVSWVMTQRQNP